MGCCSLKERKEKMGFFEKFLKFSFFRLLHITFLSLVYIKSRYNKKYLNIFRFYKQNYDKAYKEIKNN